jgi:hypothetical protein
VRRIALGSRGERGRAIASKAAGFFMGTAQEKSHNLSMSTPPEVKIHLIAGTQLGTLIVFYTNAHCWQFRIISSGGEVFGEKKIFYLAEAAEKAGREWISAGS